MSRLTIAGIALLVVLVVLARRIAVHGRSDRTGAGHPVRRDRAADQGARPARQAAARADVISFDKRLLSVELPDEEVILGDQRRLIVDSFTVFRITDPLKYYQAVGPARTDPRPAEFHRHRQPAARAGQQQAAGRAVGRPRADHGQIRDQVNAEMPEFGVSIEDVRIRRADLPQENTQAILQRMQSERQRVAAQARAEGAEASQRSAPTPNAIGRCCWRRLAPPPTICAARARGRLSAFPPRPIRRMPTSFRSGAPCRLIGMRSSPARLAWCLPRTTIFCAIFSRHRRRGGR